MSLPCVRTIRKYLSSIDTYYGFDDNFFELFKKRLDFKIPIQKHGLLVFDEMSIRDSLSVKSHSLTYSELVDFRKED